MKQPYESGEYTPWSFMLRYYDSQWNEIEGAAQVNVGMSDLNRLLAYWTKCQELKAQGVKDDQNLYWKLALITIEVQHG
jgi:hypothetical protein